ncbi:MAG: hypothetical protein LAP61_22890 [Acidobacteriia bacterium]|nr:hypothetical protein [Terriglobia bacterium]
MGKASRGCRWLMLAVLLALVCACSSRPTDPNALPSWISAYPGSAPKATGSAFLFETKDPAEKVLDFYEAQLGRSGVHKEARGGGDYGGFLSAADDSHSRNVMIEIRSDKGASEVTITPVQKK